MKWRPAPTLDMPQPEWEAVPGAPDSVIADTWWTGVWALDVAGRGAAGVAVR